MLDANIYKGSHLTLHRLSTHHGLCLGIVWTSKIWCVVFLETNSTTKLVIFFILKNAPCSKLMSSKLFCLQTSAKIRVPTMFARMVSTLWLSHQSTFGWPVTPVALNTWEGFAEAIYASNCARFSNQPDPYSYSISCFWHIFPRRPPIQLVRP